MVATTRLLLASKRSNQSVLARYNQMYHCCPAKIGPSVLDCDLACLAEEAKRALDAGATCKLRLHWFLLIQRRSWIFLPELYKIFILM
jgi:hypothetical protein